MKCRSFHHPFYYQLILENLAWLESLDNLVSYEKGRYRLSFIILCPWFHRPATLSFEGESLHLCAAKTHCGGTASG